jgi:hypothetical protein
MSTDTIAQLSALMMYDQASFRCADVCSTFQSHSEQPDFEA